VEEKGSSETHQETDMAIRAHLGTQAAPPLLLCFLAALSAADVRVVACRRSPWGHPQTRHLAEPRKPDVSTSLQRRPQADHVWLGIPGPGFRDDWAAEGPVLTASPSAG